MFWYSTMFGQGILGGKSGSVTCVQPSQGCRSHTGSVCDQSRPGVSLTLHPHGAGYVLVLPWEGHPQLPRPSSGRRQNSHTSLAHRTTGCVRIPCSRCLGKEVGSWNSSVNITAWAIAFLGQNIDTVLIDTGIDRAQT